MKSSNKVVKKQIDSFLISWNIRFKFDRIWRKKYKIPFGSEAHLNASQIDIYLDIYEDVFMKKSQEEYIERQKNLEDYKKTGNFLKEIHMTQKEEDELFAKIKIK